MEILSTYSPPECTAAKDNKEMIQSVFMELGDIKRMLISLDSAVKDLSKERRTDPASDLDSLLSSFAEPSYAPSEASVSSLRPAFGSPTFSPPFASPSGPPHFTPNVPSHSGKRIRGTSAPPTFNYFGGPELIEYGGIQLHTASGWQDGTLPGIGIPPQAPTQSEAPPRVQPETILSLQTPTVVEPVRQGRSGIGLPSQTPALVDPPLQGQWGIGVPSQTPTAINPTLQEESAIGLPSQTLAQVEPPLQGQSGIGVPSQTPTAIDPIESAIGLPSQTPVPATASLQVQVGSSLAAQDNMGGFVCDSELSQEEEELYGQRNELLNVRRSKPATTPKGKKKTFTPVSPTKYLSAEQVTSMYSRYKNPKDVGRLAVALAKHTYFGPSVMSQCTLTGRGGTKALDRDKVDNLKANIRSIFPKLDQDPESDQKKFSDLWSVCEESIRNRCKSLRARMEGQP